MEVAYLLHLKNTPHGGDFDKAYFQPKGWCAIGTKSKVNGMPMKMHIITLTFSKAKSCTGFVL